MKIPRSEMDLLTLAENIRHVAVHNGGKVSQEFVERTGRSDLVVGDFVPITFEEIDQISQAARFLSSDLFQVISKKLFGITDEKMTGTWRRNKHTGKARRASASKKPLGRAQP